MLSKTRYDQANEFRRQSREFSDEELGYAIQLMIQEVRRRSTTGGRPELSLCLAKDWVRNLNWVARLQPKSLPDIIAGSADWPMLIPAHKQLRKKEVSKLTTGSLRHLGHRSGLNLASPKQFDLISEANLAAYRLYREHYLWRHFDEKSEDPVSVSKALKTGGEEMISGAFSAAIAKLPKLSSKNYKRWVSLLWKWGQYVNEGNIMEWGHLKSLIGSLSKGDRTPSVVRSRLQQGFKAIAQRA